MPTLTTNYSLNKPLVNNATDQDLWGGYLNDNMDTLDTQIKTVADSVSGTQAIPAGSMFVYGGAAAPAGYLLCYGQAINRVTYAALFTAISTTYGVGDGSTTFNVPDIRGRVVAGQDDMGGSSADRLTNQTGGLNGDTLGAVGGAEAVTLDTASIPSHSHTSGTLAAASDGAHTHTVAYGTAGTGGATLGATTNASTSVYTQTSSSNGAHTHTISGSTDTTGGAGAHNNVQPTIILNYIIKT